MRLPEWQTTSWKRRRRFVLNSNHLLLSSYVFLSSGVKKALRDGVDKLSELGFWNGGKSIVTVRWVGVQEQEMDLRLCDIIKELLVLPLIVNTSASLDVADRVILCLQTQVVLRGFFKTRTPLLRDSFFTAVMLQVCSIIPAYFTGSSLCFPFLYDWKHKETFFKMTIASIGEALATY